MRSRIILITVILSGLFSTEILLGKKGEVPMTLSVRQQVDSEIHNLKRNLESMKKPEDRWKALEKAEKEIHALRGRSPRQFEKDEIYMDTLMASLEEVPRQVEFKKDQCDAYRTGILAHFDPKGGEQPAPPIARTLEILKILCHE